MSICRGKNNRKTRGKEDRFAVYMRSETMTIKKENKIDSNAKAHNLILLSRLFISVMILYQERCLGVFDVSSLGFSGQEA